MTPRNSFLSAFESISMNARRIFMNSKNGCAHFSSLSLEMAPVENIKNTFRRGSTECDVMWKSCCANL